MSKNKKKICLISSSGGHYEQLKKLKTLENKYDIFWVTEKTDFESSANYYLPQTGLKDKLFPLKMLVNLIQAIGIYIKEQPDYIITTGTMVAVPISFLAKLFKKKLIYIETFSRIYNGTKTGQLMYKYADLFIIQWEPLKEVYPDAIFGGSIY